MTRTSPTVLAALLALAASGAAAQTGLELAAAGYGLNLSIGADYSQGKYGTPVTSKQWTFPLIAKYEADTWSARVAVPYIWVENPSVSRDGTPLPCAGSPTAPKESAGLGDVVAAGTATMIDNRAAGFLLELTGKIKFGTGDAAKCLGTGENDYAVQIDPAKTFGAYTLFGTVGWRHMGDPPGVDFKNPWYFSAGLSYKLSGATSFGIVYDFRQRLTASGSPVSEATAFLTQKLGARFKLQGYVVAGFSDASPSWAAGAIATWAF